MRIKLGDCVADSGQLLIVDPALVEKGFNYQALCRTRDDVDSSVPGYETLHGVLATSGRGKGTYSVYADTDDEGYTLQLVIDLQPTGVAPE
jgi:hypothetical protein